ncbi:MAG: 2-oxoacid:acceptor oxidoreductase family protein [Deltaproteobacteria bacterium]|nr:2-oxoacid:acceptor oxidoreductase family protein [Deltaproteobacteria bacterium]
MIEIRIHGRGGQGAVIASKILACAFFSEDYYVQAFPKFGVERRGAPVEAFLRIDRQKILLRNNIYTPDHIIVLDHTLIEATDVTAGLKEGGWIITNAPDKPAHLARLKGYKIACVDANQIAAKFRLGSRSAPIVNTAILGGFAKATGLVKLDSITTAIRGEVPIKASENAEAATEAYQNTII